MSHTLLTIVWKVCNVSAVDFYQSSPPPYVYTGSAMTDKIVTLDVREDIRAGREPFSRIMKTAAGLHPGDALLLIAPFEPTPLYRMLAREGFSHQSHAKSATEWEILFSRSESQAAMPAPAAATPAGSPIVSVQPTIDVDARGLEPPQPMVTILEALANLPAGANLRARTDRRPLHLYAQLEERGFRGETTAEPDGSFVTRICRI
jgi:uncharacterized protein (DUF2249 family)